MLIVNVNSLSENTKYTALWDVRIAVGGWTSLKAERGAGRCRFLVKYAG